MYSHDLLVFVGRFRPFTLAHKNIVETALERSSRILVLVGSCDAPRTPRNPFSFEEVRRMIWQAFPEKEAERIRIESLVDFSYDDSSWIQEVQAKANLNSWPSDKIGLIGHSKDQTSYYIKKFPSWGDAVDVENFRHINATDIRRSYFMVSDWEREVAEVVPGSTLQFLREFRLTKEFSDLQKQNQHIADYPAIWGKGPHLTSDSVCLQAGNILLIERGGEYGHGQLALPGGFLSREETLLQGAIRELKEETRIDLPQGVLEGSFVGSLTFDDPHRDLRARIITTAHLFDLGKEIDRQVNRGLPAKLTNVKGADDAKKAFWVPLSAVTRERMFADHFHIIKKMLSIPRKTSYS